MRYWTFFDFVDERGQNAVRAWIESLGPSVRKAVKAQLNARLQYLETCSQLERPYVAALTGYSGILEIRLKVERVQYRPLCCHGPAVREITILTGAIEKDDTLLPLSACDTALARRSLIMLERRYVSEHDFS